MSANQIIFYILSAFTLLSAFMAMTTRKIFRAAVFLLFSLVGVAGIYFWMHVEFIAAVQIVVYVGGIVVLIIFSIFLTQQTGLQMPKPENKRLFFSVPAALSGFILTFLLIYKDHFQISTAAPLDTSVNNIGTQMMNANAFGYTLPFEVISVLLLAAMIGCIVIAIKSKPEGENSAPETGGDIV